MAEDEKIQADQSFPRTVILEKPIKLKNGTNVDELVFREGRAGDLRGVRVGDGIDIDDLMKIAGRMCGHGVHVVHRLSGADAAVAIGIAKDFFTECLATGSEL